MVHKYLFQRGKSYFYRRRIPIEVAHLDTRREIKITLKTADLIQAAHKAEIYNEKIEEFWRALIQSGNAVGLEEKYAAAVRLAKAHGYAYKTAQEIAQAPLQEILSRIDRVTNAGTAAAFLGGADVPKLRLSACLEQYWDLCADLTARMNDHRKKKWKNPRQAAMKNFIGVVSDKPFADLARADILAFREWWNGKIKEGWSAGSANKQMRMVRQMIERVAIANEIDIDTDALFKKTRFAEDEVSRPPFEAKYVNDTLLKSMDGLFEDARLAFYALADTGARPAEILNLKPEDIFLDDEIPHIWIRGDLKTKHSERKIPLVGAALYAFRQRPQGFNMRWQNADSFSNIVNNYMREKSLLPTPAHKLYSLRHTFKDRLRDAEAPEEIIDDLMGHKKSGPKYGRGHLLETKLKWLEKIAYKI